MTPAADTDFWTHSSLNYLFAPFTVFQLYPIVALLPAAIFLLLAFQRFRKNENHKSTSRIAPELIAGFLWLGYAYWEYRVQLWAVNEIAPIRVDLLLIYPVLILISLWSLMRYLRSSRQ